MDMKILQKTTLFNFLKSQTLAGGRLWNANILRAYTYDAAVFVLEKGAEKTFTKGKIVKATGIKDIDQYSIFTSWLYLAHLSYINSRKYNNILLVKKKFNVRKSNLEYKTLKLERSNLEIKYVNRAHALKIKAKEIRDKKIKEQEQANAAAVWCDNTRDFKCDLEFLKYHI